MSAKELKVECERKRERKIETNADDTPSKCRDMWVPGTSLRSMLIHNRIHISIIQSIHDRYRGAVNHYLGQSLTLTRGRGVHKKSYSQFTFLISLPTNERRSSAGDHR